MTPSRDRCKLISIKPEYLSHQVLNLQVSPFCLKSNLILCYFCQSHKGRLLCDCIILFCGIKSESFSVHNIWDQILLFQQLDKSLNVFRLKLLHQSKIRKSTPKVILNIKRMNLQNAQHAAEMNICVQQNKCTPRFCFLRSRRKYQKLL